MSFLVFCIILVSGFLFPISSHAAIPAVIPDSVNTDQLYSGSFDPQYPNKEFVPNDPGGVTCEFTVSEEQDVGPTPTGEASGPTPTPGGESNTSTGKITINKKFSNENVDLNGRALATNLYEHTPCDPSDPQKYAECRRQRNNSMDTRNTYGASSPVQRQLSQSVKNKLFCERWNSGILSGNHVMDTDEQVGCYCGGNEFYTTNCPGHCRAVYFSELAFAAESYCPLPKEINDFYSCTRPSCPVAQREPKVLTIPLIPDTVSRQLLNEASLVPKGSVATRVTQVDNNKSSLGVLPFHMAPSSNESIKALGYNFPVNFKTNSSAPPCSPVTKPAGPDEYHFDLIAAIIAFFTGGKTAKGEATFRQEFSTNTIEGLNKATSLNYLLPQKELDKNKPDSPQYATTGDRNNTILNPGGSVRTIQSWWTPASEQHL